MRSNLLRLIVALLLTSMAHADPDDNERRTRIAELRTLLAAGYYARAQYSIALDELKIAFVAAPDYAPAYSVQGLIYMDLKEWQLAEENFQKALRLDAGDPDTNHNYGWFLCNRRNKPAEALRYLNTAVRNPLYATPEKTLQQAGLCALKAGNVTEAEGYLRQADKAQPNNPSTVLGLAKAAIARASFDAARDLLGQHARLTGPTAEGLWLNLQVERKLNNTDSEAGFAKELKQRFPDSPEATALAKGQYPS